MWIEHLAGFSPERLTVAFNAVEKSATRWPVPANIIAELPSSIEPYVATRKIEGPEAEAARERIRLLLADTLGRLS
jgi:hypothetical protein